MASGTNVTYNSRLSGGTCSVNPREEWALASSSVYLLRRSKRNCLPMERSSKVFYCRSLFREYVCAFFSSTSHLSCHYMGGSSSENREREGLVQKEPSFFKSSPNTSTRVVVLTDLKVGSRTGSTELERRQGKEVDILSLFLRQPS